MNSKTIGTEPATRAQRHAAAAAHAVLPQHERHLRDAFGSRLVDGSCVVDAEQQVGYVRLEFGTRRGPDSPYWDGWFSVTATRGAHPLRGKVMTGAMVSLIGPGS
jgi:hypothetical protein